MIISSSKRIIKRPDNSIERYIPPVELAVSSREPVEKKLSFPPYTKDGNMQEEEQPAEEMVVPIFEEQKDILLEMPEEQAQESDPALALLEQKKQEAKELLEAARKEAARILEDAAAQAEKEQEQAREAGIREGYESGYREGREKAEAECRKEFEETLRSFQEDMRQALHSVETAKEHCVRNYLEELKDCAVAVGEKVIHISLRSSGEVIKQMIIAATEKLKKTAWVKIYIDKCDYDMMMKADADILDELSHLSDNIKFIVMDKEERGNCIIEMPEEIVDVSVNTQIENIKDILENVRV